MKRTVANHREPRQKLQHVSYVNRVWDSGLAVILATLALLIITAWSYWPIGRDLLIAWQSDDDYSAGQLVPLVAMFLLWHERKRLAGCFLKPCWAGGIALLLLAEAARIFGLLFIRPSAERYVLVLAVAGLVLMVAGVQVFRRILWILLFLLLMVPLPSMVHNRLSAPLRTIATTGSVFVLEAFGATVSRQGNVMILNETTPMAVAEACSGLRMLTAFVIVAAFVAYMVKRPRWQKAVLLLSSIPVAVACNIVRLCVTAVLFMLVSAEVGQKFFHDFAGLAMMPVAALLLFAELRLMDKLIVSEPTLQQERTSYDTRLAAGAGGKQVKRRKKYP